MNQQYTKVNGLRVILSDEQVGEFRSRSKGIAGFFCGAIESSTGYACTCREDHGDEHVAHDPLNFPIAVWDDDHRVA